MTAMTRRPLSPPADKKKKKGRTLADAPSARPNRAKHERKYLFVAEWRKLLEAARLDGLRSEALMLVMYETGMRREEPGVLRLSYADRLHRSILYVFRGKGSTDNDVDLSKVCRDALVRWIDEIYPEKRRRHGTDYIFPGQIHRPDLPFSERRVLKKGISGRTVYNIYKKLAISAGLPNVVHHPHTLKHSRVQHLIEYATKKGINPMAMLQTIAAIIGHASARTTIENYMVATSVEKQFAHDLTDKMVR